MRPQQQGRRQRNRNSGGGGNRRNQNPLSRNYESNGPDVKIRGNAQVIADKYATLARDALSSGDNVMAENYLQHAEHYNRIILAAQAQAQAQREEREQAEDRDSDDSDGGNQPEASGGSGRRRDRGHDSGRDRDRDRRPGASDDRQQNGRDASDEPQPVIGETPVEVSLEQEEQGASEKPRRATTRRPRKPRSDGSGEDAGGAGTNGVKTDDAKTDGGRTDDSGGSDTKPVAAEV
ncbi:DUF4167 domain-containing protein [Oricola cellulosilytica]|uniref:DUF4167 domain-containing protein n=1 Tax=Oricola cellulosilytica TaxID=1429082 RepID=A0A4R0P9U6_9HYPH|nr:DUF4167 domain-containing protein [Oricola cellulosilytica]TCD13705.1 DUF4167 domain-containing protein [Oricola cellulosilytica]